MFKKSVVSLETTHKNYLEAAHKNFDLAYKIVLQAQNTLVLIALAELAFLGTTELFKSHPSGSAITSAGILLGALFSLTFSMLFQTKFAAEAGEKYYSLSEEVKEFRADIKKEYVSKLPDALKPPYENTASSKIANALLQLSIALIVTATLIMLQILWLKVK